MLSARTGEKLRAISEVARKGRRVKDLRRLMNHPDLWMQAYLNIQGNKGALTRGIDTITMDGYSPERAANLVELIREACREEGITAETGPVWTTDAPYREFVSKIVAYHHQGVLAVDMETSAMYALGLVREVDVCNLLVVSDELLHEWKPAFRTPELDVANDKARHVILKVLEKNISNSYASQK